MRNIAYMYLTCDACDKIHCCDLYEQLEHSYTYMYACVGCYVRVILYTMCKAMGILISWRHSASDVPFLGPTLGLVTSFGDLTKYSIFFLAFCVCIKQFLASWFEAVSTRDSSQVTLISDIIHQSFSLGVGPSSSRPYAISQNAEGISAKFRYSTLYIYCMRIQQAHGDK